MKTLILNGSPHKDGDTAALTKALKELLPGEIQEIFAYRTRISPCIDCRRCWKEEGCVLHDEMDALYAAIKEADAIVIASPLYYSELTGSLLSLGSRLQCFYTARRFLKKPPLTGKRGGIILVGGGDGGPERALATARILLQNMGAKDHRQVLSLRTDSFPAKEDAKALAEIKELAEWLAESVY